MSERTNDPTFQEYSCLDDERRFYNAGNGSSSSSAEPPTVQQDMPTPHENSHAIKNATSTNSNPNITSYNGVIVDVRDNGGYHFNQNGKIFYKKGAKLYGAEQIPGGNYSVAEVPEAEAKGIFAKEIKQNGQPVFARNNNYRLYGDTVYGVREHPDGSLDSYTLSPHEDEYVYQVAHSDSRTDGGLVAPLIDPTDALGAFASKAGFTAARASGSLLRRSWSSAKAGSMDMIQDIATQPATSSAYNEIKGWIKDKQ